MQSIGDVSPTPDLEAVLTEGNESTLPIIINGSLTEQIKLSADIDANADFGLNAIDQSGNASKFRMPVGGADGLKFDLPPKQISGDYVISTSREEKNADFTAQDFTDYIVKGGTITVTDGGTQYTVFVESGTAVIGGVSYGAESLVYRVLTSGVWNSSLINSGGATGSFTTVDLKTVTVINGLITSIV